jgi:oligosaccharide repeat unit polymerase
MNIYILILFELIFFIVNFYISKKQLLNPACISILTFIIATFLCSFEIKNWNIKFSNNFYFAFFIGFITITLANVLALFFPNISLAKGDSPRATYSNNEIVYDKRWRFLVLLSFILTIAYGVDAYLVGIKNGASGLNAFGVTHDLNENANQSPMNFIIRQGFKFVQALGYVSFFFLLKDLVLKKKGRRALFLLPVLFSFIITIFSGSRTEIFRLVSAGALYSYFLLKKSHCSRKFRFKFLFGSLILFAFIGVIGFFTKSIVKSTSQGLGQTTSLFYYINYYIGSPVAVFSIKIQQIFPDSIDIPLFTNTNYIPNFVYLGNLDYGGNVSTQFSFILNYGIIPFICFLSLTYFFGILIFKSINIKISGELLIVSYGYFYWFFTMAYYNNVFFAQFSFSNITIFLLLIILFGFSKKRVALKRGNVLQRVFL